MKTENIRKYVALALFGACAVDVAQAKPWFENPVLKATVVSTNVIAGYDPHYMNKSDDDQYLAINWCYSANFPVELFSIPELEGLNGTYTNTMLGSIKVGTLKTWLGSTKSGATEKGVAVSVDRNVLILGDAGTTPTNVLSVTLDAYADQTWSSGRSFPKLNANGSANTLGFDGFDFGHAGTYLYSDCYTSGYRQQILKWTVNTTDGTTLTLCNVFTNSASTRIRNVSSYYINSADWVFYGEGDAVTAANPGAVWYCDATSGESTLLCTIPNVTSESKYDIMNVKISGIGTPNMFLYVQTDLTDLFIYDLTATGSGFTATYRKTVAIDDLLRVMDYTPSTAKYRDLEVSNDGQYMFFITHATLPAKVFVVYSKPETVKQWFEDPQLKATVYNQKFTLSGNTDPHYMNKSEDDQYLAVDWQYTSAYPVDLYSMTGLEALSGVHTNGDTLISSIQISSILGYTGLSSSWNHKAAAISFDRKLFLTGVASAGWGANGLSLDEIDNGTWTNAYAFTKFNANGTTNTYAYDGSDFGHNGTWLYSNHYDTDKGQVLKWAVDQEARTLTLSNTWTTTINRIRSVNAYYINGQEWIFTGEGNAKLGGGTPGVVYAINSDTDDPVLLCTLPITDGGSSESNDVMNVKVSGIGSPNMYLYVQLNIGPLFVYDLVVTDSGSLQAIYKTQISFDELNTITGYTPARYRNFEVSNDGRYAFLLQTASKTPAVYVLWAGAPTTPSLWWQSPSVKSSINLTNAYWTESNPQLDGHHMFGDEQDEFLFVPTKSTTSAATGFLVYKLPSVEGLSGTHNLVHFAQTADTSDFIVENSSWRGGAYSDEQKFFLVGTNQGSTPTGIPFLSMDGMTQCTVTATGSSWTLGDNAMVVTSAQETATDSFYGDNMFFSHNSEYLFSNSRLSANRGNLYMWKVATNGFTTGAGLTLYKTFTTPCARVRSCTARFMAGRDLVYYGEGKGSSVPTYRNVYVLDPERETSTLLCTLPSLTEVSSSGNYVSDVQNIAVSGEYTDTPYLYVACDGGTIYVYALTHDGLSIDTEQGTAGLVKTIPWRETFALCQNDQSDRVNELFKFRNFVVSRDGQYAFMAHYNSQASYFLQTVWTDPDATHTLVYNGDGKSTFLLNNPTRNGVGTAVMTDYDGDLSSSTIDIPSTVFDDNYYAYAVTNIAPILQAAKSVEVTAESGKAVYNNAIYANTVYTELEAYLLAADETVNTIHPNAAMIDAGAYVGAQNVLAVRLQSAARPSMDNAFDSNLVGYYYSASGDWSNDGTGLSALYNLYGNSTTSQTASAAYDYLQDLRNLGATNVLVSFSANTVGGAAAAQIAAALGVEPVVENGIASAEFVFAVTSFTCDGTTATLVATRTVNTGAATSPTGSYNLYGRASLTSDWTKLGDSGVYDSPAGTITFTDFNPNGCCFFKVVNE
ncbi:MAG TPA: hypothetical protein PKM57_04085 [Kiritimatiellia bacterium]|nr:hypothetical protein [Kiritimatiellia bacterium]HPS08140.1 hypothetical protein [Kiritimatiellia bacterium]